MTAPTDTPHARELPPVEPSDDWRVGIDIGGTFTDVVAISLATGEVRSAKVATRVEDRVSSLRAALAAVELDWADAVDLIHGTTMVTNAIVEDKLAPVALVATRGFGDTLAIGRQNRRHLYRLDLPPKVATQVPAERRFEVRERLDHNGNVLEALDRAALPDLVRDLEQSGAQAIAISFLHSYVEPAHEEALAAVLKERFPYVTTSNRVNPEAREFERTATTVLSASLMPLAAGYLDRLEDEKPAHTRLHLFHSAGGMAAPSVLRDLPLGLALSGPAAGVAAAGRIARALSIEHALSFDMGGTTTDVCLFRDGRAEVAGDRELVGRPLRQAMVAVESIGAGGGSVARLDHGALVVGPESAGAEPGPACYGLGGTRPTVTDANLILGYMDDRRVLGDGLHLDAAAARRVFVPLAEQMGMSVESAALGVVTVANSAMVRALRRITVERGIDGRSCALLAFGGAGPMHAVEVARSFGISRIIVPVHSSAFSALGCVSAEMSYSQQRTVRMSVSAWDPARLTAVREALGSRLVAPLLAAGHPPERIQVDEVASIRYRGQSYAIEITAPTLDDPARLGARFFERHEQLYGFATDEDWELVAIRQRAFVPRAADPIGAPAAATTRPTPTTIADCAFVADQAVATPRYNRIDLGAGHVIRGPAIIEDAWSTVVVPPDSEMTPDAAGHLHIQVGAGS